MSLPTSLFDYPLPAEAIAQHPAAKRDHSRLMVVHRASRQVEHRHFYELPEILRESPSLFFRNTAKVIKARMFLERAGGQAPVELLLLRPGLHAWEWTCLLRPLKKVSTGDELSHQGRPVAQLIAKTPTGEAIVRFREDPLQLAQQIGQLPLPPYIQPQAGRPDDDRYQTVYAQAPVAAAAPTAGLHFTPQLIEQLENTGHRFLDLTLHVGLDTFRPIASETVEEHTIHTETYELSPEAASVLRAPPAGQKRIAIGTTSLRTMEDYTRQGCPAQLHAAASLYIYPPQLLASADALITNFHLPKSTLLCLVSAFLAPGSLEGIEWLKLLYREALDRGYRFYSYGDAMLIL